MMKFQKKGQIYKPSIVFGDKTTRKIFRSWRRVSSETTRLE